MRWWTLAVLVVPALPALGQSPPPSTDIYLSSLRRSGGRPVIGEPSNLTRRPGFDNQPSFLPDSKALLYSVIREGGPKGTTQSDIFFLPLDTRVPKAKTETPESEYSPTIMPGGREYAVIAVETDSTQRLWAFQGAASAPPRLLLERVKPVGYQAWLDENTVGVFVLGSPPTLQVADLRTGAAKILLSDIGRSLRAVPGRRALSVNHRHADSTWWVTEVDPETARATPIIQLLPGSEFFAWLPDGSLLSSKGGALYWAPREGAREWTEVARFKDFASITRLAVSPDGRWLAFVAEDGHP